MKTILIVDDEQGTGDALALLLEDEGYQTICSHNGREGLASVLTHSPDLIISDFMMPLMSGGEMGRGLRAAEATRNIPILMTSSLNEASVREYFPDYDAFLRKPFSFDDALKVIRRLLEKRRPSG